MLTTFTFFRQYVRIPHFGCYFGWTPYQKLVCYSYHDLKTEHLNTIVTRPLCLVVTHTLDAAAKRVRSFVLPHSHSVTISSVVL